MPVAGLLRYYPVFSLVCSGTGSNSKSDVDVLKRLTAGATVSTAWASSLNTLEAGLSISINAKERVTAGTVVEFAVGPLELYRSFLVSNSFLATFPTCEIRLIDFLITAVPGTPAAIFSSWSAIQFVIDDVVMYETSAFPKAVQSNYIAASGVPLIGMPPFVDAQAGIALIGPMDGYLPSRTCDAFSHTYQVDATATGGIRWKEDALGPWVTAPVNLSVLAPPTPPCSAYSLPNVSGTNSANLTVSAHNWRSDVSTGTQRDVNTEYNTGWLLGTNGLERALRRWNVPDDFAVLAVRGGYPYAKRYAYAMCYDATEGEPIPTSEAEVEDEVFPSYPAMLQRLEGVYNAAFEQPFTHPIYCMYSLGSSKYHGRSYCSVVHQPSAEGSVLQAIFPRNDNYVQRRADSGDPNPYLLAYLHHDEPTARYINYCQNPHWSCMPYFPAEVDPNDPVIYDWEWPRYGQHSSPLFNWLLEQVQWFRHGSLDPSQETLQFTTLSSEPLLASGWKEWCQAFGFVNNAYTWLGISRFVVRTPTPSAQLAVGELSAAGWFGVNCTGLFDGTGITITPVDSTNPRMVLEYDLGRFDHPPYLYPHVADRVEVDWDAANVESVKVYLVGHQAGGARVLLGEAPGTYQKPAGEGDNGKYAGSWVLESWNADTGSDRRKGGLSPKLFIDKEGVLALTLLSGFTAAKLRFEVEVSNPNAGAKILYPIWKVNPDDDATIVHENGHHQAILFPNGPGIRVGQWAWFDGEQVKSTPDVYGPGMYPLGYRNTIIDGLCFEKIVLEGEAPDTDLDTRIGEVLHESEWYGERDQADLETFFMVVPGGKAGRGVYCNTWRELPPIGQIAWPARDADMQPTGTVCQESWIWAQEPRRFVAPYAAMHVHPDSGSPAMTTAEAADVPAGWAITRHSEPTDNNELPTHLAKFQGVHIADVSPHRGFFCAVTPKDPDVEQPANTHGVDGAYNRVAIVGGRVKLWRARDGMEFDQVGWVTPAGVTDCITPAVAAMPDGRLLVMYRRTVAGHAYMVESRGDDGKTWEDEELAFSGGKTPRVATAPDRRALRAAHVAGRIKGQRKQPGDHEWSVEFDFGLDVEDEGFDLSAAPDLQDRWILTVKILGETEVSDWWSTDEGATWTRYEE